MNFIRYSMRARFFCNPIFVLLLSAFPAAAKKLDIPTSRVIEGYKKPVQQAEETIGTTPGSGQYTTFTRADLSRIGVVSSAYPGTIQKMKLILQDIRKKSPDKSITPDVQLFNSIAPEARAINRDLVVVSTGFFAMLGENFSDVRQQEDALAFILAHEYAHLLYDHPRSYKEVEESTIITDDLAKGYQVLKTVQSTHYSIGGTSNQGYIEAEKGFMAATVASPWIEAELYRAVYAPYRKEQELLADFMAADLISDVEEGGSKFDVVSGSSPIRKIYKSYDNSARGRVKQISKDLEKTVKEETAVMVAAAPATIVNEIQGSGMNFGQQMTIHAKRGLTKFGLGQVKKRLDKSQVHLYYSARDRVSAIHEYSDQFYPRRKEEVSSERLALLGVVEQFDKEHTAGAAAEQAMIFLARGDVDGAKNALEQVTSSNRFENIQYLLASADVALARLELEKAISLYRQAIRRVDAPVRAYLSLSKAHLRAGNDAKVIEALDLGARKFSVREFIVAKIDAYVAIGKKQEALTTLHQCRSLNDSDLYARCEAAAAALFETNEPKNDRILDNDVGRALGGLIKKL